MCTLQEFIDAMESIMAPDTEDLQVEVRNEVGEWEALDAYYCVTIDRDNWDNRVIRITPAIG
jgi:hypothetical protein